MTSSLRSCALVLVLAAACAIAGQASGADAQQTASPQEMPVPAGDYVLDKAHASLLFRVNHVGFSQYTGRFRRFDARLGFDPQRPETARVEVTIDPASLDVESPPDGFLDQLRGPQWLDTARFPSMTFRSKRVERTGTQTLRIEGELALHGVTQPVTLEATYNGGYASHPYEPRARIGFSARGSFQRSLFGISYGIPEPGSSMGVGDAVEVIVEAEFSGPPAAVRP